MLERHEMSSQLLLSLPLSLSLSLSFLLFLSFSLSLSIHLLAVTVSQSVVALPHPLNFLLQRYLLHSFIHSLVLSHTLLHVPFQAVLDSHTPRPGTLHYSVWSPITCSWIGLLPDGSPADWVCFKQEAVLYLRGGPWCRVHLERWVKVSRQTLQPSASQCRKQYIYLALCQVSLARFLFLAHWMWAVFSEWFSTSFTSWSRHSWMSGGELTVPNQ